MLDKNRNRHDQHNYQSVTVAVDSPVSAGAGLIVALVTVSLIAAAVVAVAIVVGQVATSLFASIATIVQAAINGLAAIAVSLVEVLPWLAGCGALVFLVMVVIRSLPAAIAEATDIRQHYIASRQPLMLEVQDVDNRVVVLHPVRPVVTIDADSQ